MDKVTGIFGPAGATQNGLWARFGPSTIPGQIAALAGPLVAAGLVQAIHGQLFARAFDPLSRLLLGGALLAYLYRRRVNWLPQARLVIPHALLIGVAWVMSPWAKRYYWGDRLASQFMDPLMLAQHASLAGSLCLFLIRAGQRKWLTALQLGAAAAGAALAVATGSRSGWSLIPIAALLWLVYLGAAKRPLRLLMGLVALALLMVAVYMNSATVHERLLQVPREIGEFLSGKNLDTSIGTRLSMYGITWEAFKVHPFIGWGFFNTPTPETLPSIKPYWSHEAQMALPGAGTHNEFLQNILRMGILGLVSRVALYFVPLWMFIQAARSADQDRRQAGYLGIIVVLAYLTAGMTTEVTHLVFTASFYALMIAAFGAVALPPPRKEVA